MGAHSRGVWLCYSVLIIWCTTVAVCSPVSKGSAARKRATRPTVVLEPTTVEPIAYDVADRAPIDPSKNNGLNDEHTATLQPEDTSSPLLVSFDDGLVESTDSNNGTFNDTVDLEDETTSSEPAHVDGVHRSGDDLADNLLFACEDDFLRVQLALSDEDCASVHMNFSEGAQHEENNKDHEDDDDIHEDPEESEEPQYDQ